MDDFNKVMQEARRRQAVTEQLRPEPPRPEREPARTGAPPTTELRLERRQGEWRYYLGDERVRTGSAIEFYVDPRLGWVRGTFHWGRRNYSAPTVRVPVFDPDDPSRSVGELEVSLPDGAQCRVVDDGG